MKKLFAVTLKRLVDDKPEVFKTKVLSKDGAHAALAASRAARREGKTDCTWTVQRCVVVATGKIAEQLAESLTS